MAALISSKQAMAGVGLNRTAPFRTQRPAASRTVLVHAQQKQTGPSDALMKTVGVIAAAQAAFLPLAGAAFAEGLPESAKSEAARANVNRKTDNAPSLGDVGRSLTGGSTSSAPDVGEAADKAQSAAKKAFPNPARDFANRVKSAVSSNPAANSLSVGAIGQNPAQQFANKSASKAKAFGNKAKSVSVPDPVNTLAAKTREVARNGVAPDPIKDLASKTKKVSRNVANPAAEYAKKNAKKVQVKAPALANKAKAKIANPAAEFAAKSKAAKRKLPIITIGYSNLQQDVLFGFGEKKAQKAADTAKDAAKDVGSKAKGAAQKVDEQTPDSFSIFDQNSVNEAKAKLKENINAAVSQKSDPAERVRSVTKSGESQEENAERVRREAENGAPEGGDARASTN